MREDTRHRILSTASDLFYRKGYNLTGINEIIDMSGIAKATLYSHFRSKEDVLLAYLDYRDQELLTSIKAYCNKKAKGNKRLIATLEFLVPFFEHEDFNGCWCIRAVAEVPVENKKVRNKIKRSKERFLGFVQELVDDNRSDLTKSKREKLARHIYLLYEGAITESHIHNDIWPIKTAIRILKDKLEKE